MDKNRKYAFSWDLLGDIPLGRPNLGGTTRVEVYRLLQSTLRDVIEQHCGTELTDTIFYEAGKLAGKAFYEHFLEDARGDVNKLAKNLQRKLREMGVGVLRVEFISEGADNIIMTVDEDLDCSGLPELNYEICVYDEGFIAGILENFSGTKYNVKEIDCWCTGGRTCRFEAGRDKTDLK